jgi:hypothetical protein
MQYNPDFIEAVREISHTHENYPLENYTTDEIECLRIHLMVEAIATAMNLVPLIAEDTYFGPIGHGFFYADLYGSRWLPNVDEDEAREIVLTEHPVCD